MLDAIRMLFNDGRPLPVVPKLPASVRRLIPGDSAFLVNAKAQRHSAAKPQPKGPGQAHKENRIGSDVPSCGVGQRDRRPPDITSSFWSKSVFFWRKTPRVVAYFAHAKMFP